MRVGQFTYGIVSASILTKVTSRFVVPHNPSSGGDAATHRRALPGNAPHGYTPQVINCPSSPPTIRDASSLSEEETSWLQVRRQATLEPMRNLLGRLKIEGFDTDQYIDNHKSNLNDIPNIGIAVSGGGYRAMLNGAGVLEAFDRRTPNSTARGQLGGLLQSSTYLSALSGGGWLVGSLYGNNFTSVNSIVARNTANDDSGNIWQFGNSIFEGPPTGDIQVLDSAGYYADLVSETADKSDAGFNITITDYWGRALSFQLIDATNGGPAYTFSSIAEQGWFKSGSAPLPVLVADGRAPGEVLVSANTTVYEFTPWEFGTQDPTVFGFAPLKYVGTNYFGGSPASDHCVTGFDNLGYVIGTSSSLFNTFLTTVNGADTTGLFSTALQSAIAAVLTKLGNHDNDIADYPNPFQAYRNSSNPNAHDVQVTLVDGGEDLQNIPLHPLIQPDRHVDVVFAIDSSADTNSSNPVSGSASNWPDGASLVATYERQQAAIGNGTAFPSIPDINTFVNLGLNNRPTFFGCDASNLTGPSPLIVYLPNAPYVYSSNVSTFDLQYNDTQRNAIILNGYNLATQGNGSIDDQWPACVGCAILSRSLHRTGTDVPSVCKHCFSKYCWDGATDSKTPKPYMPKTKIGEIKVTGAGDRTTFSAVLAMICGLVISLVLT